MLIHMYGLLSLNDAQGQTGGVDELHNEEVSDMKKSIEWMHQYFGRHEGKCKDCPHLTKRFYHNRNYYKCLAYGDTHSEASDWRMSWNACGLIELQDLPNSHIPVGQSIKHINRKECQIVSENQMSMWHIPNEEVSMDG